MAYNWIFKNAKGDRYIWLVVIFLSLFSLLAVYSSTGTLAYKKQHGNTEYYIYKHITLMIAGLFLMYWAHKLDYRYYSKIAQILLFISFPLLAYTLKFGGEINQASRWITIPVIDQSFQTSDLAKLAIIMYLARELSRRQENIKDLKKSFLPIIGAVVLTIALIAPANFSTALMLFATCCLIMLIGRISVKHILTTGAAGVMILAMVVFFGPRRETYKSRIKTFTSNETVDKDKSFQSDQSKIAIATGGLFGKGPGNSSQKNYLPHPYSDFIFSIIIEEYGMIGALMIIIAYLVFLYRSIKIVTKAPKAFGALLACGLSFSLVIQAFANMAVAVNLMPVTGVPLPLVSMGGTSILFTSVAFGIILSVSRDIEEMEKGAELATA
jgi:cell division protein FtsW